MASIYGTGTANFTPNVLGTSELGILTREATTKTGEDLVLETKTNNNVVVKANGATVATFSANPPSRGLLTLSTNAPSLYLNGNSSSGVFTEVPNIRIRNSNNVPPIEMSAFISSGGARFGTTTQSSLNIITGQSLRCLFAGNAYNMAFWNGFFNFTLDWSPLTASHTLRIPPAGPPPVDGQLTDTLLTIDNTGQLKYNEKFRCNSGAATNFRMGDGTGNTTLDIDGSINSTNFTVCPRFALINRQAGAGVSVIQNAVTSLEGLAGTTTNHPYTLMSNQVRVASAFADRTFGLIGTTSTVKLSANNATSNYTLSLPISLPSFSVPLTIDNTGQLGFNTFNERILTTSNVAYSTSSTSDTVLTIVSIPPNAIGRNGYVTLQMTWDRNNTTNTVSCGLLVSNDPTVGIVGTSVLATSTLTAPIGQTLTGTNLSYSTNNYMLYGNGTDTSTIGYRVANGAAGVSGYGYVFTSIDTTQTWYLKFIGSTTNAGTTVSLRNHAIKVVYGA